MKSETLKASVDGAATLATSTGILTVSLKFLDHYAAGIGALCTIIFGIIYVIFQFLAHRKLTLADENKKDLEDFKTDFDEHKTDTSKQFNSLNQGIDNILDKLDK